LWRGILGGRVIIALTLKGVIIRTTEYDIFSINLSEGKVGGNRKIKLKINLALKIN